MLENTFHSDWRRNVPLILRDNKVNFRKHYIIRCVEFNSFALDFLIE